MKLERYGHGGDLRTAAEAFGRSKEQFLDYSSNMNPWGPPEAVGRVLRSSWQDVVHYPDPAVRELTAKLAAKHGVKEACLLVGNGAAELIDLAVRALQPTTAGLARPSFSEYEEALHKIGCRIHDLPLTSGNGFTLQWEMVHEALDACDLLFLGHPNNPTGRLLTRDVIERLKRTEKPVIVDEAFLDFSPREEELSLAPAAAENPNLIVIRSMTKFYSIPGLRLGYAIAHPDVISRIKRLQVPWSVNALAQWIGCEVLEDYGFAERTKAWLPPEREWLSASLRELGLQVTDSDVNYILFSTTPLGLKAKELQETMGRLGVLIRDASLFPGLGDTYVRVAVKRREQNEQLLQAMSQAIGMLRGNGVKARVREEAEGAPAAAGRTVMLQGTASDVGKSLLTAALCRILLQDGYRVAPFKSQNMSLNSYVTPDGKEIGRAQGMQADACRIPATTDMNPILLKPKKDMVAQVVVHGKPYKDLSAREYRERYLSEAELVVKEALGRLREQYEIVVLEGAGSPAEVNLKKRDIVNMRLAGWADAPVVLVADIDRGGVFASLVGTLEILTPEERDRVKGFVINKFRGDVSLLKPGLDWLEERTGKPVLGVIPYLPDLGLEDEDSASLERRLSAPGQEAAPSELDIAVIKLPRLSNFTDIDPLLFERDVRVRFVSSPEELGRPDAIVLPGSKNTVDDLLYLRDNGLEQALKNYVSGGGFLTGICAGYQMMGERLLDPLLVESDQPELQGMGFFPSETVFASEKRTVQSTAVTRLYCAESSVVTGYEIHMGETTFLRRVDQPFLLEGSKPDGASLDGGRVWGTYLHGILHNDAFRRGWLNRLRENKGLAPLPEELQFQARREAAFDRLAAHVREHLDLPRLYEMMGIPT
ncbi:cobyric acid synthase [Paenibacillus sp. GD4]|uniref:cobyric acid synthase n=1 Tax=Paenibacillus sp. GD4 TaxID=3068890 RepID=UPI0027B95CA8|nr:cobyric acid synthase [Paenibacillus sp. GD4]